MEERKEQLNELSQFIKDSKRKLQDILEYLEWNREDTLKVNTQERTKSSKETKDDPEYPQSFPWPHSVSLDSTTITSILKEPKEVPQKFSETQTNFNREQKLALYEYTTSKTGKFSEPELSISVSENDGEINKEMTFAEIVALKRNLKRRRLKYRTTKAPPLSHTEEVRNLIDLQMQAFRQYINPDKKEKSTEESNAFSTSSKRVSSEESSKIDSIKDHRKKEKSHGNSSSKSHKSKYKRKHRSPSLSGSSYKRRKRSRSRSRHRGKSYSGKSKAKQYSCDNREEYRHEDHKKKHNKSKHKEFSK